MKLGVIYLKLSGLDLSSSSSITRTSNNTSLPAAPRKGPPSTIVLGDEGITSATTVAGNPLPATQPVSTASISPPEKDVRPSSITQTSNDTSLAAAPKQGPPPTIVLGDKGITSATTVARNPLPTKQLVHTASISPLEKDVRPSSITRTSNNTSLPAAPKQGPPPTIVLGDEEITSAATVVGHPLSTKQPVSTDSISPPKKDVRPSSITRRYNDTSLPPAPKEGPLTTIVLGDEGITSATTVAGHPLPTKQPVSPRHIFPRSRGSQPTASPTPLPAGIAGSSLSAMGLFQGLPSADTILFATLTTRPKTQTSEEASEAIDVPYYYASDGKIVEFQNTPEAAQAMLHLSLKKTLPVGVLLDALISLDGETTCKPEGGKFKRKLSRFSRQVHSIR